MTYAMKLLLVIASSTALSLLVIYARKAADKFAAQNRFVLAAPLLFATAISSLFIVFGIAKFTLILFNTDYLIPTIIGISLFVGPYFLWLKQRKPVSAA